MPFMPIRYDTTTKLVHLMKGDPNDHPHEATKRACDTLMNILRERKLRGGTGFIKGAYRCVCFTEAPVGALAHLLASPHASGFRYRPFGIMVDKSWLQGRGGRPVIYEAETEFDNLPDNLKYLHVRYDLRAEPPIDFTWEREWRVRIDELPFTPRDITVILPSRDWCEALVDEHTINIRDRVAHAVMTTPEYASAEVVAYPWNLVALSDLGFDVPY